MITDDLPSAEGEDGVFELGMTTCPNCSTPFMKRRGWQVFCGDTCRMKHHQGERRAAVAEYRKMMKSRFADKGEDVNRGNG